MKRVYGFSPTPQHYPDLLAPSALLKRGASLTPSPWECYTVQEERSATSLPKNISAKESGESLNMHFLPQKSPGSFRD